MAQLPITGHTLEGMARQRELGGTPWSAYTRNRVVWDWEYEDWRICYHPGDMERRTRYRRVPHTDDWIRRRLKPPRPASACRYCYPPSDDDEDTF